MNTVNLQNQIIQKILHTSDKSLLEYLDALLSKENNQSVYHLSSIEKQLISESNSDYATGKTIQNDEVFNKLEKWLNK